MAWQKVPLPLTRAPRSVSIADHDILKDHYMRTNHRSVFRSPSTVVGFYEGGCICLGKTALSWERVSMATSDLPLNMTSTLNLQHMWMQVIEMNSLEQYCEFRWGALYWTLTLASRLWHLHAHQSKENQDCLNVPSDSFRTLWSKSLSGYFDASEPSTIKVMFKLIGQPDVLTKYTQLCMYGLPHVKSRYRATTRTITHVMLQTRTYVRSFVTQFGTPLEENRTPLFNVPLNSIAALWSPRPWIT